MKMNFKFLALAAAALTFAACTDELVQTPEQVRNNSPESNAISFSTYMGGNQTRAGYVGDITNNRLKDLNDAGNAVSASTNGFGVFAHYTGTSLYKNSGTISANAASSTVAVAPNFMYNQQVKWNNSLGNDFVTKWTYSPIKYWPNEVQSGTEDGNGVDDQEDDANNYNATTTYSYGGNVSFFAYAPYAATVNFDTKDWNLDVATGEFKNNSDVYSAQTGVSGILKFTSNTTTTDPTVTYRLALDGNNVDLLWGTKGNTSSNVKNAFQENNYVWTGGSPDAAGKATVNTNLTKQKTNGVVDFLFKHALSKIGGTTVPFDANNKNGLMVVLDLDDMKGAETGGQIEVKDGKTLTKITIKSITITNDLDNDGGINKTSGRTDEYNYYTGELNLATGVWSKTAISAGSTDIINHLINTVGTTGGKLKTLLDEATEATKDADWFTTANAKHTANPGVTTTPQNVYQEEAKPLLFFPTETGEKVKLRFTIDYLVRTYDTNLNGGFSEVEQIINKIVTFPELLMNKHYSVLMHLGLTSVKFTAKVRDWEDHKTTDDDGDGELDLEQEDIWLPRNVGGLSITLNANPIDLSRNEWSIGSAPSLSVTDATYYIDDQKQASVHANVEFDGSHASWITSISGGAITIDALDSSHPFTERTGTFKLKYSDGGTPAKTIYSEIISLTQYGRIPTSAKVLASSSNIAFTGLTNATKDYNYDQITISGNEAANDGASGTAFTDVDYISISKPIFIDDATGNVANWISVNTSTKTITVAANNSGIARSATMYVAADGKRIPMATTTKVEQPL